MAALSVEIGSRPSNSESTLQAAEYLLGQLSGMGYHARLQPYTFTNFQDRTVRLLLKQPVEAEIAARTFVYSGRGAVEARLANCGLGRPSDFPASGIRGQVALIERGAGVTFQEKVSNAVARGAAAVVIYNDRSGEFSGTVGQQVAVPVVGISQFDGQKLQEQLRQGAVVVSLGVDAYTEIRQGNNVVASKPDAGGRRKVVIGGHYDSVPAGPGANDNASGVGVMMELAYALRDQRYPFDVVFVAFGDEEVGLFGSKRYVESLSAAERSQIIAMINLDMVGVGEKMEFGGDADLSDRALRIARQMGYPAQELTVRAGSSSDHASFQNAGIPAVFFHRSDDPNYHTRRDTADKISEANLAAAGRVALALLDELRRSN